MENIRTDTEIVSSIRDGDRSAFNELMLKYGRFVRVLVLKTLGPFKEEVDDTTQDVFMKVWERRTHLRSDLSIQNYLYTAAVNTCRDKIEKRKVYLKNTSSFANNADTVQNPEIKDEYLWKQLYDAIQQLPKSARGVFVSYVMDGKSYDEITDETGMKKQTARNSVAQSKNYLKNVLKNFR